MEKQKKRGPKPTTGPGMQIGMRWQEPDLAAIDEWRSKQPDDPTRAEAIRQLVKLGLTVKQKR